MEIGERIKLRREELHLSQEELALKLGYKSRSSINKIELGKHNLTQRKIKDIADALETSPAFIMGWIEPTKLGAPSEMSAEDARNVAELTNIYLHLCDADKEYLLITARRLKN